MDLDARTRPDASCLETSVSLAGRQAFRLHQAGDPHPLFLSLVIYRLSMYASTQLHAVRAFLYEAPHHPFITTFSSFCSRRRRDIRRHPTMGSLTAEAAAKPSDYLLCPAGPLPLTAECHHYRGKDEVPWDIQKSAVRPLP